MSSPIKLKPVDVVVIGAGVAGTLAAKGLAEANLKVVCLERGRMLDPNTDFAMPYAHDELKFDRHNDMLQNLARETVTFRNAVSETALPMREIGSFKPTEVVGGASLLWGAQTWRFLPWDFETRSQTEARYGPHHLSPDCTSQDWGITYEELEPYYDQFEYIYGISGIAGNLEGVIQPEGNPYEGPRTRDYPNPPTKPTYAGHLFQQAATSLGYKPFATPSASMTQPYTNPYRLMLGQCVRGGFCTSFACSNGAKASPLTTVLPALLKHSNFELRPLCNVIKINLDSTKKRATGVTYVDARGRHVEQPADLVILASYTFSNNRLMMLSGIGEPYDPVTQRGVLGRNYSYQAITNVTLFFEDKQFNRFIGGGGLCTTIDDFNGDNFDHTGLGFIGGAFVCVNNGGAVPIRSHPVPSGTPGWGPDWKKSVARYYDRTFNLHIHGSDQSYRENYLDLDPTYRDVHGLPLMRMTFDWREADYKMSSYITDKMVEMGKVIGADKMSVHKISGHYSIVPYQSTHNNGGVVMGVDPATSVVNKYLQSWDVHNVFVMGASAFPQNSAYNPTGTVGALTCWATDAIKDTYLRKPGLLV